MRISLYKLTVFFLVVAILGVICFSCVKRSDNGIKNAASAQLKKGFDCTASVNWDGNNYTVKISKPSQGTCSMQFLKPAELSPLSFVLGSDGLKVKYGGLQASLDPSSLPQTALFYSITDAVSAAAEPKDVNAKVQNKNVIISGNTQAGNFALQLGPDYKPKTLTMPDIKLNVNFDSFKFV